MTEAPGEREQDQDLAAKAEPAVGDAQLQQD